MTSTDHAPPAAAPTRQAAAIEGRSAPGKVTGRLKRAIDEMVWSGARRPLAAQAAGLTDHSLRAALRKPHVKAAYLAELDVLRTSERARNIHAAVEVRDQTVNQTARISAVRWLEESAEMRRDTSGHRVVTPGVVVVVNTAAQSTPRLEDSELIEINPSEPAAE